MTTTETARECERLFQNGGPKVYVQEPDGRLRPSVFGGATSVGIADDDQSVWARRKVPKDSRYGWVQLKKGAPDVQSS